MITASICKSYYLDDCYYHKYHGIALYGVSSSRLTLHVPLANFPKLSAVHHAPQPTSILLCYHSAQGIVSPSMQLILMAADLVRFLHARSTLRIVQSSSVDVMISRNRIPVR